MNIREEMWENCFLLKKKNVGQTSINVNGDRPSLTGDKPRLFSQNQVCPHLKNSALSPIKLGLSPFKCSN